MENTLKMLFDEHNVISGAVALARESRKLIGVSDEAYELNMSELIRFFRQYADHYHHYKEEQILFPEMAKKSELMGGGIIAEMLDNHEDFRDRIRAIENDLQEARFVDAADRMDRYGDALLDHIAVENDELFQAAADLFTEDEAERIYFRFIDLDSEFGEHKKKDLTDILDQLRKHEDFEQK